MPFENLEHLLENGNMLPVHQLELAYLRKRHIADIAATRGGSVDRGVVHDDDASVLGEVHVELEVRSAQSDCLVDGAEGIFGGVGEC